jgi:condensin-2 complex subunit G2
VPDFLAQIFILGDTFPQQGAAALGVQNQIAEICELWFFQERDKRESLIPHTLLFLMIKVNQLNSQVSELKRLYEFKEAIDLINFDESNDSVVTNLLQRSAINSLFLGHDIGKKFLSYALTIHPLATSEMHVAIKSVLGSSQSWKVEAYADIYFQV